MRAKGETVEKYRKSLIWVILEWIDDDRLKLLAAGIEVWFENREIALMREYQKSHPTI